MLCAILRSADEHLHEVVVKGIVKLALKAPFKLRVVKVARMKIKKISVYRNRRVPELDCDLHTLTFGARGKV